MSDNKEVVMDERVYRLVPTRRGPSGWYTPWKVTGWDAAKVSGAEFLTIEGVPVMICETDADGHSRRNCGIIGGQTARRALGSTTLDLDQA